MHHRRLPQISIVSEEPRTVGLILVVYRLESDVTSGLANVLVDITLIGREDELGARFAPSECDQHVAVVDRYWKRSFAG